jgi:integrase
MGSRFQLSKLTRRGAAWRGRKVIPADVRADYQTTYGVKREPVFWRKADTPAAQAKADYAEWLALIERRIEALRASKGGRGLDLTQRQADTHAADWYGWFTSQHLDQPGEPMRWAGLRELFIQLLDMDEADALERLDHDAHLRRFLLDKGLCLSVPGRAAFTQAAAREFVEATKLLERRAGGDWGPDGHEAEFGRGPTGTRPLEGHRESLRSRATWVAGPAVSPPSESPTAVFEAYCQDGKPARGTISRWRGVFKALEALPEFPQDQPSAQRWLDGLKTERRSAYTVSTVWLTAAKTVYGWALSKHKVESNPFEGCSVTVPRKTITRETGKVFTEAEANTILRAALTTLIIPRGRKGSEWSACRRWVPWLCAYTGARVGEITQLRCQDIERRACGWVMKITPEAGTVKTRKARSVPLHGDMVLQGFAAWVEKQPPGPLFHRPAKSDSPKGYRGPAIKARERLAEWVRDLGVTDPEIQPNHAWRHTFKTMAARAGIEEYMRDAICGHSAKDVASSYIHPTPEDMAAALQRFPRWSP